MLRSLVVCFLLLLSGSVKAHEFMAGIDAEWHLEPSAMQCRLWQAIPQYGLAVFDIESGAQINFHLESDRPATQDGKGVLEIRSPFWRPGPDPIVVAEIKTGKGKKAVNLDRKNTDRIVDELVAGMMPVFKIDGWVSDHVIEVGLSGVNFQEAYNGLVSCLATLYPVNHQQIKHSTVYFGANQYGLNQVTRDRLDLIAGYLRVDPGVEKIIVHGHASQEGRRSHNWELSRLRAKEVKDYLVKQGVDAAMVETFFHGETRPRFKGNSAADLAKNRRAYIEVKKPRY